jgi:hypothetical protein
VKTKLFVFVAAAAAAVASADAPHARASEPSELLGPRHKRFESPQRFAFELRFSPYSPDIDSEPGLSGAPYQSVFGTMKRLMIGAELDWQVIRIPFLGTLGPGAFVGYTTMSAKAGLKVPHVDGRTTSDEDTSLDIFPMGVVAVLRADTFWKDAGIPIIPYAKLGPAFALWRAYNETGTSVAAGTDGKGHTNGFVWALGAMFSLNFLDPYAARNFDNELGVNNTTIFAEYYSLDLTGFGQSNALRVGQNGWAFGLAFEF